MSTFYVGQRVRMVAGINAGMTATVAEVSEWGPGDLVPCQGGLVPLGGNHDIAIHFDSAWETFAGFPYPASQRCYTNKYKLVPLTDPGRELVAWSECLWQPEGVSA